MKKGFNKRILIGGERAFSKLQVANILKIPRGRLRDWVARGFIHGTPTAEHPTTNELYTPMDIFKVKLFNELINAGLKRADASIVVYCSNMNAYYDLSAVGGSIEVGLNDAVTVVIDLSKLSDGLYTMIGNFDDTLTLS